MPAPEIAVAYVSIVPEVQGFAQQLRESVVGPADAAGADAGQAAGTSLRDRLRAGAAAAGVIAGALIVQGITEAIDQAKIANRLQAQLRTTEPVARRQGELAGRLYTRGITENVQQGADAIRSVMQSGIAPPDATNAQLEQIATKAADVANVFEQDLSQVTNAVSQMLRTGMAPNASYAFDVITVGLQSGANKADDLLDTFNEYSTQFRKLGLDGASSLGIINQLVTAGARDSDIAADALKEFSIRAVDMSTTSIDAYEALGLNGEQMSAHIARGGEDARRGLDTVIEGLKAMTDPLAREAAAVGLFGTQAEDLGEALFAMDVSSAAASLGDFSGAAQEMGSTLRSGPAHEIEVFTRTLKQEFTEAVGGTVLPALGEFVHASIAVKDATTGAIGAVRDAMPWIAPLAVAVGGLTLALNANAIASGLASLALAGLRGIIIISAAATNGLAIAQGILNAVMALNPITLVVIAIAALVTGLVMAYNESETFRAIVQKAWEGIQTAVSYAWDKVLKPVFDLFAQIIQWLYNKIIKPILGLIVIYFKVWWTGIKLYINFVIGIFKLLGLAALWLYDNAVKPAFDWISDKAKWLWHNAIKPVIGWIVDQFNRFGEKAKELYNRYVRPAFDDISNKVSGVWNDKVKPAFSAMRDAVGRVADSFTKAKDAIAKQWQKVEQIAEDPVSFLINTVYNGGIVPMWNKVAGAFGAPKLSEFHPEGFASGGILPGYTPGRDVHLAALSGGEAVMRPEWTRGVGAGYVHAMNRIARTRGVSGVRQAMGGGIPAFADGGIFGWIGNAASGAWDTIKETTSWLGNSLLSSARAGVNAIVNPLVNLIPGADTQFGQMIRGIPSRAIDAIFDFSEDADSRLSSLKWLKPVDAPIGTPYGQAGSMWASGYHTGTDFPAPTGTLVRAVASGVVSAVGSTGPYGNHVRVDHPGGLGSLYAHLSSIAVRVGEGIGRGSLIGRVGSTGNSSGPHLHLEAFRNGARLNPATLFDDGGWLRPGVTPVVNKTGRPEAILTADQWNSMTSRNGGLQAGDRLVLTIDGRTELEAYVDRRASNVIDRNIIDPTFQGRMI
ncbi:peptidoglycan DD-metalloendopeptidase family protein [Allostreptomyces psammosilenae]|uniref:Phage-related minor tail protein n=1 Tax=Allostreptomyces psammosilenae TaxID=1892865 RepID=A0A853A5V6_9ACTN|nr:peptidoglycan DD-metalloendopeptidase family protein [Allostreptomyces psammosilenae]NYI06071.1 phage-related minor tail protein [Allostreptomyces psammosilenae]